MVDAVLDNIRKTFNDGQVVAVDDISMHIEEGELIVLVGPSGCGKSTTLRCIAGLETIDSGEINFGDHEVSDLPPKDRAISMVFQNYALYPSMTVYENMSFGLRMRGADRETIDDRVQWAADIMEIGDLLDRYPDQLSGGQQQRVALGRAIVREPALFLLDEPLSNLDAKLRAVMRTEIQELQQKLGVATVFVTHDQEEAMSMGDRIAVMNAGQIQQIAPPTEIYHDPNSLFVADFIGSPAINFFESTYDGTDTVYAEGLEVKVPDEVAERLNEDLDGEEVIMAIRPEDIDRTAPGDGLRDVDIEVVEPMGDTMIVYFDIDGRRIRSVTSSEADVADGDTIGIDINWSNVHFFRPDGPKVCKWKNVAGERSAADADAGGATEEL